MEERGEHRDRSLLPLAREPSCSGHQPVEGFLGLLPVLLPFARRCCLQSGPPQLELSQSFGSAASFPRSSSATVLEWERSPARPPPVSDRGLNEGATSA